MLLLTTAMQIFSFPATITTYQASIPKLYQHKSQSFMSLLASAILQVSPDREGK